MSVVLQINLSLLFYRVCKYSNRISRQPGNKRELKCELVGRGQFRGLRRSQTLLWGSIQTYTFFKNVFTSKSPRGGLMQQDLSNQNCLSSTFVKGAAIMLLIS